MTAFEAYEAYIALKKHFDHKSSYDFFKYHGKMKLNKSSFDTRRDKFYFKKIANLFPMRDDLVNFYVSGFIRKTIFISNGKPIRNLLDIIFSKTWFAYMSCVTVTGYRRFGVMVVSILSF